MKKIDLLIGPNDYSTVAHFSRAMAFAFKKLGIKVRLFSLKKEGFHKVMEANFEDPCDLTFSFSDIRFQGMSLGAVWNIPHFTYLLDPAIYYLHHMNSPSFVSCVDKRDLILTKHLNKKCCFLPHGVDERLFNKEKEEPIFDIVMMGTCFDLDLVKEKWHQKYGATIAHCLEECAADVLTSDCSIIDALMSKKIDDNIALFHHEIDLFIGTQERIDLLRALDGLPLHIWGKGAWKKYFPKAHIHPPISFNQALKVFSQAKVVLNTSTRFKEGGHERIFYALALHALPLTNDNPFIRNHFEHGKNMLSFTTGRYENVKETLSAMLSSEKTRNEIVAEGRSIVANDHTWYRRADHLLQYLTTGIGDTY